MTTQPLKDDTDSAELASASPPAPASEWPDLDKLVEDIKTKRTEEQARQEAQRAATQKAQQDAERAWENLQAVKNLDELSQRLLSLGVVPRPVEGISGGNSVALELTRLPKGETAIIRIDTSASRNGPPRTTVQVQRGTQQLPALIVGSNSSAELRKTLVDIAQKLLG